MEYPELGWTRIQELSEKLAVEDRKVVESLLDKIEILYWELEKAKLSSKAPTYIPSFYSAPSLQIHIGHQMVGVCRCEECAPAI